MTSTIENTIIPGSFTDTKNIKEETKYSKIVKEIAEKIKLFIEDSNKYSSTNGKAPQSISMLTTICNEKEMLIRNADNGIASKLILDHIAAPLAKCANIILDGLTPKKCQGCTKQITDFIPICFDDKESPEKECLVELCKSCFKKLTVSYLNQCIKAKSIEDVVLELDDQYICKDFQIYVEALYKSQLNDAKKFNSKNMFDEKLNLVPSSKPKIIPVGGIKVMSSTTEETNGKPCKSDEDE